MREQVLHVAQGEQAVSDCPKTHITTLLGSCVAACLWDPGAALGGLNHFLLPEEAGRDMQSRSFGTNAMELLINDLLRRGAVRSRLRAKLFGGARMISGLSDIGAANARFALEFCRREGIPCVANSLGGTQGRRIRFWPVTGKVQQLFLRDIPEETLSGAGRMKAPEVELF